MDKLEKKIRNIAQSVRFSSEEKQALRTTLLQHMEDATVSSNYSEIHARRGVEIFEAFSFLRLKYAPVAFVAGLLFIGGGVTYAAEGSLPGDTLYPVKLLSEDVRGAVAIAAEDQLEWDVRRAERRLEEAEALAAENRLNDDAHAIVAKQFEEHADRAIARISDADESNASIVADLGVRFEASLEAHEAILESFAARDAGEEGKTNTGDAVRRLSDRVRETVTTLAFLSPVETAGRGVAALRAPGENETSLHADDVAGGGMGIATLSNERASDSIATTGISIDSGASTSAVSAGISEATVVRVGAAADAELKETTRLFEARRDALSDRSIGAIEGALAEARASLELGSDLADRGEFAEGFHAYRTSLKLSRRISVFLEADVRLNLKDLLDGLLPEAPVVSNPDPTTDEPADSASGEEPDTTSPSNSGGLGGLNADVKVSHTFANGTHRYQGTITLPNPCYSLDSRVAVAESFPEQIHIELSAKSSGGFCAQVIAEKEFDISARASERATVRISLNGEPLDISLSSDTNGGAGIILPVEPDGGNGSGAGAPDSAGAPDAAVSDVVNEIASQGSDPASSIGASAGAGAQGSTGSVGASVSGAVKKAVELFR